MKAHIVVVVMELLLFCSIIASLSIHVDDLKSDVVEEFIRNSSKTVSIISIDDTRNFIVGNSKAFVTFKVESETFVNCDEFAKADKYSNVTSSPRLDIFRESYSFKDFIEVRSDSDYDNVIFSSSFYLDSVLECFTNAHGTFLIFLTDNVTTFNDKDMTEKLNKTWRENGVFNIFVSTHEFVYSFDPFHRNPNGVWGKLNPHSKPRALHEIKNLNGYPMNVEMFQSTFIDSSVENPNIDDFTGPDAYIAKFVRERLNAKC